MQRERGCSQGRLVFGTMVLLGRTRNKDSEMGERKYLVNSILDRGKNIVERAKEERRKK